MRTNKISDLSSFPLPIIALSAAAAGEVAAVLLADGSLHAVSVSGVSQPPNRLGRIPGGEQLAWSSGNFIAVGSSEGRVHLLQPDGKEVAQFPVNGRVGSIAFNPSGDVLAVGLGDAVELFSKAGNAWTRVKAGIKLSGYYMITSLTWSDDGA